MSKVSEAKAAQNFRAKPVHPRCADCQHFTMDRVEERSSYMLNASVWIRETNLRCSLGGFKVGKQSVCDRFAQGEPVAP